MEGREPPRPGWGGACRTCCGISGASLGRSRSCCGAERGLKVTRDFESHRDLLPIPTSCLSKFSESYEIEVCF